MLVADTSAWIEYLSDGLIADELEGKLKPLDNVIVPTLVQLELARWILRERPDAPISDVIAYTQECILVRLGTSLALDAAEICRRHKLATADAIIYATAIRYDAQLITCDAHFEGLPGVIYLARPKPMDN